MTNSLYEQAFDLHVQLNQTLGPEAGVGILTEFQVAKVEQLEPGRVDAFIERATDALNNGRVPKPAVVQTGPMTGVTAWRSSGERRDSVPLLDHTPKPLDSNPKTLFGAAKATIWGIPEQAMFCIGEAFRLGVEKYGLHNWRDKPVTASTYFTAARRHMAAWKEGEEWVPDDVTGEATRIHHLDAAIANLVIIRDASIQDTLHDDRPTKGRIERVFARLTRS